MESKLYKANDVLLIMALPQESRGLFEKENIQVHYCGIGKVNAAFKTTELILKVRPQLVLNLGTAGSHKFPAHTLVECKGFVQRDMDVSPLGFPLGQTPVDDIPGLIESPLRLKNLPSGVCGTADVFEVGPPKLHCDLVDMEAYAMAKVSKRLNTPFMSVKYITDGSDDQAHKDWSANLPPASMRLLEIFKQIVE